MSHSTNNKHKKARSLAIEKARKVSEKKLRKMVRHEARKAAKAERDMVLQAARRIMQEPGYQNLRGYDGFCDVCEQDCDSEAGLHMHEQSRKHRENEAAKAERSVTVIEDAPYLTQEMIDAAALNVYCDVCDKQLANKASLRKHEKTKGHLDTVSWLDSQEVTANGNA